MYDLALSFAGEDRGIAETVAIEVRNKGFKVFYDFFEKEDLWGEDLTVTLPKKYKNARFCVIFISDSYLEKMWTRFERQVIIEHFLKLGASGYVLPVFIGNAEQEVPGLSKLIGYRTVSGPDDLPDLIGAVCRKLEIVNRDA